MSRHGDEDGALQRLAEEVARACGFAFVPPVRARRGRGGEWWRTGGYISIGAEELKGQPERLWYVLAHELAHAQARSREGHSPRFWRRLAHGLQRAGRLELLRHDFHYREGALRVAREFGLADVPPRLPFRFRRGDVVQDSRRWLWTVVGRFRRSGQPFYRLRRPGWAWRAPEAELALVNLDDS